MIKLLFNFYSNKYSGRLVTVLFIKFTNQVFKISLNLYEINSIFLKESSTSLIFSQTYNLKCHKNDFFYNISIDNILFKNLVSNQSKLSFKLRTQNWNFKFQLCDFWNKFQIYFKNHQLKRTVATVLNFLFIFIDFLIFILSKNFVLLICIF